MFVVFTSTVEVRISAVYMGRVPLAEHDNMPPCIANREAGNITTGGTNWLEIKLLLLLLQKLRQSVALDDKLHHISGLKITAA